ncbi:MAG: dienelactone hydrolase family protein [Elusimicrobia bacterium]|nr:dienelactone hydrolase family protein [Elusimicrobiota bacterium]
MDNVSLFNCMFKSKLIVSVLGSSVICILFCFNASAKIITKDVEYKDGKTVLEGFLAYDDSVEGKRPGVLIVHEWNGLGSYVKNRAQQIAQLGYVAFCADIYGKGIRPKNTEESAKQAGIYRADRILMRRRVILGLEELINQETVDPSRIVAIGYCFGGGTVLELARSGIEIAGVISFHGNLDTPNPKDSKNIKAKVLVLQGSEDPAAPPDARLAFQKEMDDANVDWQMIIYGGAVHGFTNPANGNDPTKGVAYNEKADKRSWNAMELFFNEIFSGK